MDANKKMPKNAEEYYCEKCRFVCSKKSNYNKHLGTLKHQNANNANKKPVKIVNALDQNQVSLFGAPMETYKNKTNKKSAIIKRR